VSSRFEIGVSIAVLVGLMRAAAGRADWPVNGAPISVFPCAELPTATVADDRGGMYVVWTDNRTCSNDAVYVQRVTGSGSIAAGWPDGGMPVWPLPSAQGHAAAIGDGSGGVIVVWEDGRSGSQHLYAQRIAPDAARLWTSMGVAVCDASGDQVGAAILPDGAGGVFVAWRDTRRGLDDGGPHPHQLYDLYAQHINGSGAPTWPASGDSVATNAMVYATPSLATDGSSGVLVTWLDRSGPAYFQHLDAAGSPHLVYGGVAIAGRFLGITDALAPLVVPDGAGGMISTFMYGPDTQQDLFAQRVDSTGALVWPLNGVLVATAPFDQRPEAIIPDGTGGAYIAWHDLRNGQDWDVYVQRISSTGATAPGWPQNGLAVCTMPGFQIYPELISDSAGGCVLVWDDARNQTTGYDVYAQRITAQGSVAGGWPANGTALCSATGDQVSPLTAPDGTGGALVAWGDYRVYADVFAQRVGGAGQVGDASVVGVASPGRPRNLRVRAYPNPFAGQALQVWLSLPDAEPAELSFFDLKGSRIAQEVVPASPSGQLFIRVHLPDELPPGVYVVRLSQARRVFSTKVSILK
jgi:hypothetical protein